MMKAYQMQGVEQNTTPARPQHTPTKAERVIFWAGVALTSVGTVVVFCGVTVWLYSL